MPSDLPPMLGQRGAQVDAAKALTDVPGSAFVRWPWPRLDGLCGGIGPGTFNLVAGFTGGGKSTFLLSMVCRWIAEGRKVVYAGLESPAAVLRTQLACRVLGYDPGWILSGDYRRSAGWESIRSELQAEIEKQRTHEPYTNLTFAPYKGLSVEVVDKLWALAPAMHADIIVIDHLDHAQASADALQASRSIVSRIHDRTVETGARVIAATQTNWSGMGADRLRNHRPVLAEHIFMGGHKLHVADLVLGVYRPLDNASTMEERQKVRDGALEVAHILAKRTTAVNLIKHRLYGERQGAIALLGYSKGDIINQPLAVA